MYIIICEIDLQSRFDVKLGTQGWCTGMTLRDGMGRVVGGGSAQGDICIPMADSCQYMAKTFTIL